MLLGGDYSWAEPDDVQELGDLQELELAGLRFVVDHTPGHTEGSVTFRSPYDQQDVSEVMFSGDLLFAGSIGRTDLPGGDHPTMLRSLATKVLPLADDVVVLPGHGEQTSIGRERATNPFLHDLPRRSERQGHPAQRVPRAAARVPRRRAAGHRRPARHLRAARVRRHRDAGRRAARPAASKGERSTRRSTSCAGSRRTTGAGDSGLGLHFDLTVPFARYVLENAGKLEFPFRRYQIQPAWRGERPQEGRYREFTQADIDVVGRDELPFHHDVEVCAGDGRGAEPPRLPAADVVPGQQPQADPGLLPRDRHHGVTAAIQAIDQLDKMPRDAVKKLLDARSTASPTSRRDRCLDFATISTENASFVERVRALGRRARAAGRGAGRARPARCAPSSPWPATGSGSTPTCASRADSTTTPAPCSRSPGRGLRAASSSVCGGGRYDTLANDGSNDVPRRGRSRSGSPGRSSRSSPTASCRPAPKVPSAVLVALVDEESRPASDEVATALRRARHRHRGGRERAEVRQADQVRRAARYPVRLVPRERGRWHAPGQGHPQRRPGPRRPRQLDPVRHAPTRSNHQKRLNSDPHPRRRRSPRRARRPDRDPRRLGGQPSRSRRGDLHRPARGQWRRPGRHPRGRGRAPAARASTASRSRARSRRATGRT